jgi:hypothetical protein
MWYTDVSGFQELFGQLTTRQLWLLTKFAKHVRLRCRSNAAFNNYMNSMFPYASFKQVTKTKEDGSSYEGLTINSEDDE